MGILLVRTEFVGPLFGLSLSGLLIECAHWLVAGEKRFCARVVILVLGFQEGVGCRILFYNQ